ncbi:MAG: hypothetical protein AAGC44_05280 [Planctomycetota bacterium]
MLRKNVTGQKLRVFAFDLLTGEPVTGDASQITCRVAKDWASPEALADTNPAEVEDGYYLFDLSQAETDADVLDFYPESSTADVQVIAVPGTVYTMPAGLYSAAANYTTTRGLAGTSLPDAAADSAGGLPVSDAGGLDLDNLPGLIEAALVNEGDATALLQAIADKIAGDLTVGDLTAVAIAGAVRAEIDANSTQLAAIVGDTNELQADLTDGGRLDALVDAIKAKTDNLPANPAAVSDVPTTDAIEAALLNEADGQALLAAVIAKINSELDVPALELTAIAQAVRAEIDAASTQLAAILEDTATTLPAAIAGVGNGGNTAQEIADALLTAPSGSSATGSAMALLTSIIARTAEGIVLSSAFLDTDGATLLLRQGESYAQADANAIEIEVTDYRLTPAVTSDGTSPVLRLAPRNGVGSSLTVAGAVVSFDSATSTAALRFEVSSTQSATLKAGVRAYRWEIDLQLAGSASRVLTSIIDHPCTVSEQIA